MPSSANTTGGSEKGCIPGYPAGYGTLLRYLSKAFK